jgi:hypothetical protein
MYVYYFSRNNRMTCTRYSNKALRGSLVYFCRYIIKAWTNRCNIKTFRILAETNENFLLIQTKYAQIHCIWTVFLLRIWNQTDLWILIDIVYVLYVEIFLVRSLFFSFSLVEIAQITCTMQFSSEILPFLSWLIIQKWWFYNS